MSVTSRHKVDISGPQRKGLAKVLSTTEDQHTTVLQGGEVCHTQPQSTSSSQFRHAAVLQNFYQTSKRLDVELRYQLHTYLQTCVV